jgi:hypothetical protein
MAADGEWREVKSGFWRITAMAPWWNRKVMWIPAEETHIE